MEPASVVWDIAETWPALGREGIRLEQGWGRKSKGPGKREVPSWKMALLPLS